MSLKLRLIFSFSLMVFFSAVLGGMLILSSSLIRSQYGNYNRQRQFYDLWMQLREEITKQKSALDEYILGLSSEREPLDAQQRAVNQILDPWKDAIEDAPKQEKEIPPYIQNFEAQIDRASDLASIGGRKEATALMENRVLPAMEKLQNRLGAAAENRKKSAEDSWAQAEKLSTRVKKTSTVVLLFVLTSGLVFSVLLYRSISVPLEKLKDGVVKIGAGQWDFKLEIANPEEIADLAHSFEGMAKSLKEMQVQVVQMGRMSAVGTLAGGVAHEINNPLTGVLGQSQMLLEKLPLDDPHRASVEKIERAALRCKKIVRGLLDFSRPQDYAFASINVDTVIESTLSLCETEIRSSHINILWKKNPALPGVRASENHLQQVFLNLVTNSMHAMPKGGDLTIETQEIRDTQSYRRKTDPPLRNYVEIKFSDTGIGVDPKNLPHLFDPFFTTKEPGKGTGLGLSISFGIIQQHEGHIAAMSAGIGKGSSFIVRLPIHETEDSTEKV